MQILVAEDDKDASGLYKDALELRGHKVTLTVDGHECLAQYKAAKFDVVILDYKLPDLDGLQVAKEIFSINPSQRIILSSAVSEASMSNLKELSEAIEVFPKPFEPEEIVAAVEKGMTRK
jgi:DNA-binding response OmpR family regulator